MNPPRRSRLQLSSSSFSGLRGCSTTQTARRQTSLACCQHEDIPGSVHIPVRGVSARQAFVDAIPQSLFDLGYRAARTTDLGRSSRIDSHDYATSLFSSVAQRGEEASPSRIMHASRKNASGQPGYVQVFNSNQIVPPNEIEGGFKVEVSPDSMHAAVLPCICPRTFAVIAPTASLLGKGAVGSTELCIRGNQRARVGYNLPVAGGDQGRQAKIHADAPVGRGQGCEGHVLTGERNPPVSARISRRGLARLREALP
jgi:hypothetical protein